MFCDSHIHVGQFFDIYTSPEEVSFFLDSIGIQKYAVSSTTVCEGNYSKALDEIKTLIVLDGDKVSPILWITPEMIKNQSILKLFLDSSVNWKCLKIHPQLDTQEWDVTGQCFQYVLQLARKRGLPLLIHTGEHIGCYPETFDKIIDSNPDIRFILAHGRPIKQALALLRNKKNVYVDTAFMPIENIKSLVESGFEHRILWGTDYPIQKYFYQSISPAEYYQNRLLDFKDSLPCPLSTILTSNYISLFEGGEHEEVTLYQTIVKKEEYEFGAVSNMQ